MYSDGSDSDIIQGWKCTPHIGWEPGDGLVSVVWVPYEDNPGGIWEVSFNYYGSKYTRTVYSDADALELLFDFDGSDFTLTRGNYPVTGYVLGTQTDKPLQPKGDYALKSELPSVPVQSVNGKTGAVVLTTTSRGSLARISVLPPYWNWPTKQSPISRAPRPTHPPSPTTSPRMRP